jgi:formate hydrogenlyase subunit 3/multisubunit Na+/H+ antiporter MnhD subunit
MSVFSWALVLAYDYAAESRSAAYIYLLIASFGALMLLIADSDDFAHLFRFYFDIVFL